MIKDVLITKLDVIDTPGGNVMHAMKESSIGYSGFGEAYFSKGNDS
jgi:dTDP-4-dehydrorhamnose 3,5-epimerase